MNAPPETTKSKDTNGTHIGHLNVYHLQNKVADVSVLLNSKPNLHILGISETKISNSDTHITNDFLSIPNYEIERRNAKNPLETGLAVYVHHNIYRYMKRREDLEPSTVECIWLEIKYSMSPSFLVGFIYRNPAAKSNWFDDFTQMMVTINNKSRKILLLGDLNFNLLKSHSEWESTTAIFGLTQLVPTATRITYKTATLLDHIYSNSQHLVTNVKILDSGISDHFPTICTWLYKPPKLENKGHTTIHYRSFKYFSKLRFCHHLSLVNFREIFNFHDPIQALESFYEALMPVIDKHAPLRHKRVKSQNLPGWLTPEIREAMKIRDKLKGKTKGKNTDHNQLLSNELKKQKEIEIEKDKTEYKKQRNRVTQLIRDSKKEYFNKMINNNTDVASLWKAINNITKTSKKKYRSSSQLPPNTFNNHFINIVKSIREEANFSYKKNNTDHCSIKSFCDANIKPEDSFQIPLLAVHEVGALISSLKNKKSMGPDNLNPSLIKLALPYIVESLTFIYNKCIENNIFPPSLKAAKVIPLPKSKDTSDINNFRPISLLPVLSKPLEKHVQKCLMEYLEENKLLYNLQSGFRHKHSCQTALTRMCDTWLSTINHNNSNIVGAVYLDFKKAFDFVDHDILLRKLSIYLKNQPSVSFFESFLKNRSQRVFTNGSFSSPQIPMYGVPQGSILGPLLFCIFINDLPICLSDPNVSCDLFADDTTLHCSASTIPQIQNYLQKSLNNVTQWCQDNLMLLHPGKTKSMIITSRQKHQNNRSTLHLSLDNTTIDQVKEHKVLGVIIDEELKWESHINAVTSKFSRSLFLLNKLKPYIDTDARKMFFHAHCLCHINYASVVWDGAAPCHSKRLTSLYKRAINIILPDPSLSIDEKQIQLNILPLQKHLDFNKCVLVYKVQNELTPDYLSHFLMPATNRYGSDKYILPRTRIDLFKSSFAFSGATLWNSLPSSARMCSPLKRFKNTLYEHFMRPD